MGTKQTSYLTSSKYVYIKKLVFHTIIKVLKGCTQTQCSAIESVPLSQIDTSVWYFSEGYESLIHESSKDNNLSLYLKL